MKPLFRDRHVASSRRQSHRAAVRRKRSSGQVPEGGALIEVTCRTLHGRFLLKPSRRLNNIVLGVLGRAQHKYPVQIVGYVFLSNHYHLLLWVPEAQRLASFMNFFNANLAKEAGRLANWREKFWGRRYQAIVVSDEPRAQISRLKYPLSHGVKEGFVRRPSAWPGVHCAQHLLAGGSARGIWVNRTKQYNALMRGQKLAREELESEEFVTLTPLPCWGHIEKEEYESRIAGLLHSIEQTGRKNDRELALPKSPRERPLRSNRSPAPYFHCASKRVRRQLFEAYHWFVAAHREATERLSRGDPTAVFPEGSFPPPLPYVSNG